MNKDDYDHDEDDYHKHEDNNGTDSTVIHFRVTYFLITSLS